MSQCTAPRIVYRYIPRTFDQEFDNPVSVSKVFAKMFTNTDTWMEGVNSYDRREAEKINKYFISQM